MWGFTPTTRSLSTKPGNNPKIRIPSRSGRSPKSFLLIPNPGLTILSRFNPLHKTSKPGHSNCSQTKEFILLHKKRTQGKARGELGVLALINKRLTLILSGRSLSTNHLPQSGNLRILSLSWFSDLKSYFSNDYKSFTSTYPSNFYLTT